MASQRTLTLLFAVHSWAGIVTGVLLFVICMSGALAVFKHEIDLWGNPSLRQLEHAQSPVGPQAVLAAVQSALPDSKVENIVLPTATSPAYFAQVRHDDGLRSKIAVDAGSAAVIGPVDSELGQFVRMLHVFLFFAPRWIVGFLGAVMLVLALTGIVIHRKIMRELFTVRWRRSSRLAASDLHKASAIWGLAFHLLIAFTGCWLGLAPVFEQSWRYLSGGADPAVALPKDARKQPMQSLDALLLQARRDLPGLEPETISLRNAQRADAVVTISGDLPQHLISNARVSYAGADGRTLDLRDPRQRGFWSRFDGWMEPLHFGDFGGLVLKALYCVLGLSAAGLAISGTVIWADRRRQQHRSGDAARSSPSPEDALFDRIMAALLTAAPTALLLCAATSLWLGRRLELLPGNQGLGPWLFILFWLLLTTLTARATQPVSVWRRGLYGNAAGCATVALSGLLLHAPQAGAMAAACAVTALACSAGAMLLPRAGIAPVRAPVRARRNGLLRRCMNGLPWWVLAACFVESFRIAQTGGDGRGAGHTGMLLAFFVLLPALSLVTWFRGPARLAWLIGSALLGWLALAADRPVLAALALTALLCARPLGGRTLSATGAAT